MSLKIDDEYLNLLLRKTDIERTLLELPKGYISKKMISGKEYNYLQYRDNDIVKSQYLKNEIKEEVSENLVKRKEYELELKRVKERINEIEAAAKIIDDALLRRLTVLKLSAGMDLKLTAEKEKCLSFAEAMTSIEGIEPSKQARDELNVWKDGKCTFLKVFENTLKRYGFPVEA